MATVVYSSIAITQRLNGVVTAIGNGGFLVLKSGATTLSTITLGSPSATVNGTTLTFNTPQDDLSAAATGSVDTVIVQNSAGSTIISGLTVGIPISGAEVIISNGLNSTVISSGQVVALIAGQITGS